MDVSVAFLTRNVSIIIHHVKYLLYLPVISASSCLKRKVLEHEQNICYPVCMKVL